ncbi:MAG: nucleotidyltransferase domain-containing protein [Chloroflexi bacterium]|nr:nucleotidyltransferase domain-containing protein [Chloroflexota bacterium]
MKTWSEIRERREARRRALEDQLHCIVEQLKALGAVKIILFGSLARGDVSRKSDLDIIAIMPSSLSSHEWMKRVYAEAERGTACDILTYNETDWQEMLTVSRFLRHALREGKVLYETGDTGGSTTLADASQG